MGYNGYGRRLTAFCILAFYIAFCTWTLRVCVQCIRCSWAQFYTSNMPFCNLVRLRLEIMCNVPTTLVIFWIVWLLILRSYFNFLTA